MSTSPPPITNVITRAHRELAIKAMYPDCTMESHMWLEFVDDERNSPYPTLTRVAQAIADAQSAPVVHVGQQRDFELVYQALRRGQISALKVDAQRAFDRLFARARHDQANVPWVIEFRSGSFLQASGRDSGPLESAMVFASKDGAEAFMRKHEWCAVNGGMALPYPHRRPIE